PDLTHYPRPPSSAAYLPPLTPVRRRGSRSSWRCLLALTSVFQSGPASAAPSRCHRAGIPLAVTGQSAMSCTDRPCVQVPVGSLSRSPGHSVTQAPAHTLTHLQVNAPACPPASREDPHMRSFRHADQRSRAALHVGEGVVDRGVGAGLVEDQLHESTLRSSEIQSLRAATGLVVGPQQILALLEHGVEDPAHYVEGDPAG